MLKKASTPFLGFLQATGLLAYIALISTFLYNIENIFSKDTPEFYAPIIMILLFVISATISASIVLGRPAVLFWEKKYSDAFKLVGWTVGWGILYFATFVLVLHFS